MVTDFRKDISRERISLHIPLLQNVFTSRFNIKVNDIKVVSPTGGSKVPNIDRLFYFYRNNRPLFFTVECKTDDRAHKTGNVAIELITSIDTEYAKGIPIERKLSVGSKEHEACLKVIEQVQGGKIRGNMGFGIMEGKGLYDNMMLSYLCLNEESKTDTYLIMNCKKMSEYLADKYMKMPFFMTQTIDNETNRSWNTIGVLFPMRYMRGEDFVKFIVG